ncbi:MAG: DUF5110 domain-containing protein [Bacteroidaceae bacterium]|nr:DUF5110 domain-containing protein [Bacteroidaceae bacterium]
MRRLFTALIFLAGTTMVLARNWQSKYKDGQLSVTFVTPTIVHVEYSADGEWHKSTTGVCVERKSANVAVKTTNVGKETVRLTSDSLVVDIDTKVGALTFKDRKTGKVLLRENAGKPREAERVVQERIVYDDASARIVETANGKVTVKDEVRRDTIGKSWRYRNRFEWTDDEGLYGLGSHMEDYMNLRGKTMYLTQHNLKAMIPVLNSTKGYGLLFDAGCAMKLEGGCVEYEAAKQMDYYFMAGKGLDAVIKQYRYLTGDCPMMPRYMFGYIQSKERYVSSDDLLRTLGEYRRRHVPIDMIVQDWNYWPEGWGYMKMDSRFYPDPKALADSIHAMNAKLMVSIWPNPQYCPQAEDFKKRGYMLEHSVYDAFNADARKYYWSYADREFFSKGFDAWWCDCSEPLDGDWTWGLGQYGWDNQEERWHKNKDILSDALGAERSSLYSLYHAMGIYENQRAKMDSLAANGETKEKRVLNLTRSSYAGQQRYATITWNGDTHASWESFRQQIPAGLNFMATGCPYWTVDVGSFFTRNDGRWFYKGEFPNGVKDPAYCEYYTRMFQWGTFLPMLRSHGSDTPREIWQFGEKGTKFYDALLKMINLRYELIPYMYSMAGWTTRDGYTMARLLAFDFADDPNVLDIKDEYMFGKAFLVCPVTEANATSRKVYLPKGASWINYWTGKTYEGGQYITETFSIDTFPLYVRAGSIVPTAPVTEYSDAQMDKDITINVYNGNDATFLLYEDDGDGYDYENGKFSEIMLSWNNKSHTLNIGARKGDFKRMKSVRRFIVKTNNGKTKTVTYSGKALKVRL